MKQFSRIIDDLDSSNSSGIVLMIQYSPQLWNLANIPTHGNSKETSSVRIGTNGKDQICQASRCLIDAVMVSQRKNCLKKCFDKFSILIFPNTPAVKSSLQEAPINVLVPHFVLPKESVSQILKSLSENTNCKTNVGNLTKHH